jgi:hypothetical protein
MIKSSSKLSFPVAAARQATGSTTSTEKIIIRTLAGSSHQ